MRAFIFTLDALFAITVAVAALAFAAALTGPGGGPEEGLELQHAAQESLAYLDNSRTLARLFAQSESAGNSTLNATLPDALADSIGGRLIVHLYEYNEDADSFNFLRTVGATRGSEPFAGSRGYTRRLFAGNVTEGIEPPPADPEGREYFGLALLETWYR
jgi:hypothetical protein